jgi:serine/threonine-protein kinase RsbW
VTTPIRLTIPASPQWVVLIRTATTAVCARLDFSMDRLDDLRLAVDEVASLLIKDAVPDSVIECELLAGEDGRLDVTLSTHTNAGVLPPTNSFSWTVLTALVDDVTATVDADRLSIHLRASASENTVDA